ncbi:MAG: hypothetical protein K6G73_11120 [Marinilabiliaceae bacterium]|nr:hypothetical protein [Bacteroidales bacterium]MCR5697510.1 hypothetical protein [Marinilabiliaceae bacterium]
MFSFIKSILVKGALLIILCVFAQTCISNYVNGGDAEKIEQLKKMIEDQTIVTADLSENYIETTVLKSAKTYQFDYTFTLNGQNYCGKIMLNGIPNTTKLNLYYLNSNPQIVSQDPYSELNSEQEKGSISDLIWGILWVIIAALICISLIRMFVQKKAAHTKEEEPIKEPVTETQQVQEEPKAEPQIDKEDPSRFMPH